MNATIDALLKQLTEHVDTATKDNAMAQDVKKAAKAISQSTLAKLDLVTREEFDAQTAVLLKTREKLDAIEKQLNDLNK